MAPTTTAIEGTSIPTELSDQWNTDEHKTVRSLIDHRRQLLAIAANPESSIDDAGRADGEAEDILTELRENHGVEPHMLLDDDEAIADIPEVDADEDDDGDGEFVEAEDDQGDDSGPGDAPVADTEPAGRPEDPREDEEMEQLTLPGAGRPGSRLSRKVMLEAKFIGKGTRLTHEVTDPDSVFRLMALVRFDHNQETPQRSGSGLNAKTESVLKTQHFRVLQFEIREDVEHVIELLENLTPEERAQVRVALNDLDA